MKEIVLLATCVVTLACSRKTPSDVPAPAPAEVKAVEAKAPEKGPEPGGARLVDIAPGQPLVEITVTEKGYEPDVVTVEKGKATHFKFKRVIERTCADGIVIPAAGMNKPLGMGETVEFALEVEKETRFGCPMGMMIAGTIKVR